MTDIDPLKVMVVQKTIEYQFALVSRRWQYFATYLIVNGLLFNAYSSLKTGDSLFITLLSIGSILTALVFQQLISLATTRLEKSQISLSKFEISIVDYPLNGRPLRLRSETIMLYIALTIIPLGWFYLLFHTNLVIGAITTMIFISDRSMM